MRNLGGRLTGYSLGPRGKCLSKTEGGINRIDDGKLSGEDRPMTDAWKSYPGAPMEGAIICPLETAADGGATCVEVDGFPLVILRRGDEASAFVNACPHRYLPLNHKSDRLLSADGSKIRCSNLSAGFDAVTGEGVEGLGLGACLDPAPVFVSKGQIVLG